MKTTLTIEESANLIELGVDEALASHKESNFYNGISNKDFKVCHLFTIADLLSILPKEISLDDRTENLNIVMDNNGTLVGYPLIHKTHGAAFVKTELIDSLYQLLIWAIEHNFVNLNTDKK